MMRSTYLNLANPTVLIVFFLAIIVLEGCKVKPKVEEPSAIDTVQMPQVMPDMNYENIRNQVIAKVEKKINDYSYHKVSDINVEINEAYATASCPVKETFKYIDVSGILREEVKDKVYTLEIFFKKYEEFEIIKVELWDEGNRTKKILE